MAQHTKLALAMTLVALLAVGSAQATSHVRIVRVSYEDGNVQMEHVAGQGLERAILNSPVVEGSRIVTGADGLAEVEFENNSTVRLGEATDVRFRQLLINDDGDKVNEVELVRGTMYFDARSGKNDIYRVIFADRTFVVRRDSQVRFVTSGDRVQVAVFNGEAQFDSTTDLVKIKKNNTLTVDSTNPSGFLVAKEVTSFPLDRWNSERAAYQTAYAYNSYSYGDNGLGAYGFQDLAYYGGFMNVPGYGLAWQPYGVSGWAGWNPYIAGAWAFTPGFGYAWASAYPWGWMPYHYGSWSYLSGTGWFWVPGNSFRHGGTVANWQPTTPVVNGPTGYRSPTPPVTSGTGPRPSILVGQIGRVQAYIPGGPVPPNFRSVVDRPGVMGMTAPMARSTAGGSAVVPRNSRSATLSGAHTTAVGSTFTSPAQATARGNVGTGHVFATPSSPGLRSGGLAAAPSPSFGRGPGSMGGSSPGMRGGFAGSGHAAGTAVVTHGGTAHK